MNFNLRHLIKEYIKEHVEQHENFNNRDLTRIGSLLIKKLENLGFLIKKSTVSFKNIYCFDAEKLGKVYQVNIRKKFHSINEDSEVEKFDRNELKKYFPNMFKNVQQSSKVIQNPKTNLSSTSNNLNKINNVSIANDDTLPLNDDDVLYTRNIEYTIEFQDKSKDFSIAAQLKRVFNNKENKFENFVNEFTSDIVKNFNK